MRLIILCEGDTEEKVLEDFFRNSPYCPNFETIKAMYPSKVGGSGRLKFEFKKLAEDELSIHQDAFVFCLIDLYKAPYDYPKYIYADADPYLRQYEFIKQKMESQIVEELRPRFRCFPVVIEIETWLLADEEALNTHFLPPHSQRISQIHSPETMTGSPVDLLNQWSHHFRDEGYHKIEHGIKLFQLASAERIYKDNCPHFKKLIDELMRVQGLSASNDVPPIQRVDSPLYLRLEELYKIRHEEISLKEEELWSAIELAGRIEFSAEDYESFREIDEKKQQVDIEIRQLQAEIDKLVKHD